jgi:hypothetical protein
MLEDELVYLLSADREVREQLLVDGMQALSLSVKLKAQNRPHLLLGLDSIARTSGVESQERRHLLYCNAAAFWLI